ncbi:hypothetical protein [Streptacidiphilus sp. EB129]|uniref:hypothetical protein n=1 Tax=Streptacidiphilus sp. EB129 TaxID=3156262 RepID=UPI003510F75F
MVAQMIPLAPAVMPVPGRFSGDMPEVADRAHVRFARAADVRPGDLIVGRVENLAAYPYVSFSGAALTAAPAPLDPSHCEVCGIFRGEPYLNLVPCRPDTLHHLTVWRPADWAVIVPADRLDDQIGRFYLASRITTGGQLVSYSAHRLGDPCRDCDETHDPMRRRPVACRQPRLHAQRAVTNWDREHDARHARPGCLHAVLAPIARDLDTAISTARTQAVQLVAEMRAHGSL